MLKTCLLLGKVLGFESCGTELVMNDLERLAYNVVFLFKRAIASQNGVVYALRKHHFVEGVESFQALSAAALRIKRFSARTADKVRWNARRSGFRIHEVVKKVWRERNRIFFQVLLFSFTI